MLAGADEHVRGGDYVGNRMFLWIVAGDPDRERDVVGRLAEGDGESAMETEQELGSSVVVSCGDRGVSGGRRGGEREGLNCRRQSLDGWRGSGGGGGRRRRRRGVGWSRNEYFRAARSVWGREASSDERIRNAQGDVIVCQRVSRSPSASCPPDRQYNISRLLAHFLLSGSFTGCAVLGPLLPPGYKRPSISHPALPTP